MPFDVGKFHFGKVLSGCEVMFEMYSKEYDKEYIKYSLQTKMNSDIITESNVNINNLFKKLILVIELFFFIHFLFIPSFLEC